MDLEVRPVREDEFGAYSDVVAAAFGEDIDEAAVQRHRAMLSLDRTIGVFEDGEVVGTAAAFDFELTLPGGTIAPAAGVTNVSVRPTHRRHGLLRRMMTQQLDDVARRGEPLAILQASEGSIYGRFGYGPATFSRAWTMRTTGVDFQRAPSPAGRLRVITAGEARKVLPVVFDQCARRVPGALSRSGAWWDDWAADPDHHREGATARQHVVHESAAGEVDGYATWRRRGEPVLLLEELYAADDEVAALLFRFLFEIDLVTEMRATRRPADEPVMWRLADPRRLAVTSHEDDLYVRIIDVAAALAARGYGTDDELVLEVADRVRPDNDGRWELTGGSDGASCRRTTREPDLALSIVELGSIYLGGVAATSLARAGRIDERTAGAVRRADLFFLSHEPPWLTHEF